MSKKKAYVIGTNVKTSLSPLIFQHWFNKYGLNAKYSYKEIKEKNFDKEVGLMLGEEGLCGINVTIPFKEKIIKKLHNLDKAAKTIGAVNCVTVKNNKYFGTNTDWSGFQTSFVEAKIPERALLGNKKVALVGYGGAAKAILYSLSAMGLENVIVFNRTNKKIDNKKISQSTTLPLEKISNHIGGVELIINTIPGNVFKIMKIKKIEKKMYICDIVYQPKQTKFLNHFINPKNTIYGISMLINQAIPCFDRWFGFVPSVDDDLVNTILKKIS